MLHTIAHYGHFVAYGFSGLAAFILLLVFVVPTQSQRLKWSEVYIPGLLVPVFLIVFWAAAGYGLSLL